jgi:hypothetical protein
MLRMSGSLLNRPVISLRSSQQIAIALQPIINPHNLKIVGWWCKASAGSGNLVLLSDYVRESNGRGLAVNDEDALSSPDELVRHKEILNINFQLIDKTVKTKRSKLGKVHDFSYNEGMFVQKLYVARPLVKVFASEDTLIIDRTQILEVTDDHILVSDTDIKDTADELARAGAVPAS